MWRRKKDETKAEGGRGENQQGGPQPPKQSQGISSTPLPRSCCVDGICISQLGWTAPAAAHVCGAAPWCRRTNRGKATPLIHRLKARCLTSTLLPFVISSSSQNTQTLESNSKRERFLACQWSRPNNNHHRRHSLYSLPVRS